MWSVLCRAGCLIHFDRTKLYTLGLHKNFDQLGLRTCILAMSTLGRVANAFDYPLNRHDLYISSELAG